MDFLSPTLNPSQIKHFTDKDVLKFINCSLCHEKIQSATTLNECLDTFCKLCLQKYFEKEKTSCPTCSYDYAPHPLNHCVSDSILQSIIDKIELSNANKIKKDQKIKTKSKSQQNKRLKIDTSQTPSIRLKSNGMPTPITPTSSQPPFYVFGLVPGSTQLIELKDPFLKTRGNTTIRQVKVSVLRTELFSYFIEAHFETIQ